MLQHLWTILVQSFFNPETQSTLKQEHGFSFCAFSTSKPQDCHISWTACWLRPCVCKGSATCWPVQHTYSHQALTKSWQKKNALKMSLMSSVHKVSSTKLPCVQLGCGKLLMVVNALAAPKKPNSPWFQEHHLVAEREWVETICILTKTWDAKIFQFPGCQTWDATLESRDLSLEPQKTAWLPELPNITQGHWISCCWSCWSCWSWCLWCKT